jgi:RNA polymerase subunit RPABC4/transcription elongation factor Spt4
MNLFVLIAIIIDVYYQINAHREMQILYSAPGEETEPLFCEECNKKVTSDDEYCRTCGANFIGEVKCSHHPERAADYRCVVCSKPLCNECSTLIMGSHRCANHQSVEFREGWTKVHAATTFVEAQLLEEFFKENNVNSKCLSNVMGSNYGVIKLWQLTPVIPFMVARWLGGGEIKIFVPATDYNRSVKLLNEHS